MGSLNVRVMQATRMEMPAPRPRRRPEAQTKAVGANKWAGQSEAISFYGLGRKIQFRNFHSSGGREASHNQHGSRVFAKTIQFELEPQQVAVDASRLKRAFGNSNSRWR